EDSFPTQFKDLASRHIASPEDPTPKWHKMSGLKTSFCGADNDRVLALGGVERSLPLYASGTRSSSASQVSANESLGARQSPRGDNEPPEATFGPFGIADRLNWLIWKKRNKNKRSQRLIVARSYACLTLSGIPGGHWPALASRHAFQAR